MRVHSDNGCFFLLFFRIYARVKETQESTSIHPTPLKNNRLSNQILYIVGWISLRGLPLAERKGIDKDGNGRVIERMRSSVVLYSKHRYLIGSGACLLVLTFICDRPILSNR